MFMGKLFYVSLLCTLIFAEKSHVISHALRLHPGQDFTLELNNYIRSYNIKAASIAVAVGSFQWCTLRLAHKQYLSRFQGPFEIVSIMGTFGVDGVQHIHISLGDGEGNTVSGHLPAITERINIVEDACIIFTTAEVILLEHVDLIFERQIDPQTTYDELIILKK